MYVRHVPRRLHVHILELMYHMYLCNGRNLRIARLDRPLLILAGPGSGKTQFLVPSTLRLAASERSQESGWPLGQFQQRLGFSCLECFLGGHSCRHLHSQSCQRAGGAGEEDRRQSRSEDISKYLSMFCAILCPRFG